MKAAPPQWVRHALRPSAFKVGLLVTALACAVPAVPAPWLFRFLGSLDSRVHDLMFRARGREADTGLVVIVDVDERSIEALGQWPWPRDVLADLLRRICAQSPKVIGFDIVFAEEDRTSLRKAAERLARLTGAPIALPAGAEDHDEAFAKAIGEAPAILGYYFELALGDGADQTAAPVPDGRLPCPQFSIPIAGPEKAIVEASDVPRARRATLNLDCFNNQALSEGFFNTLPDDDGLTRRGSLLIRYGNVLYPSLALEMAREGLGVTPKLEGNAARGIQSLALGEHHVPLTRQGQLCVNFRGPPKKTFRYLSAVDVLRQVVPPDSLQDKYVLLGTSAIGLLDLRSTPFASAFPGVEVNANVLDNLLAGDPMVYDRMVDVGVTVVSLAVLGALLAAGLAFLGPRAGALCGVLFLLGVWYGNYRLLFLSRQLVGVSLVTAALVAVFLSVSVANYFFEGRRKRFLQSAFSLYVSRAVVDSILKKPGGLTLDGEEKELTILFTDIRGFTTLSEQMTARQLSAFLNEYLSAMTDIIMDRRGTVDKFIGDAIMAFWGAPLDDPGHAAHALSACLAMRRRLAELRPAWVARGLPPIETGIGVNSGVVSVGNMGSSTRFSYTVMGDAVNLASRLEGLTKIYGTGILVSEHTRNAAGDSFFYRPIDRVRVKGKRQPVELFEPLAETPVPDTLRTEVERFAAALDRYRARDFENCRDMLRELHAARPQTLYALYLERVELFLEQAPPPDWDGVFTFKTKGHDDE